jgi:hypothetical protein
MEFVVPEDTKTVVILNKGKLHFATKCVSIQTNDAVKLVTHCYNFLNWFLEFGPYKQLL